MSTVVLTLRFDEQMERAVRDLWNLLYREGIKEAGPPRHRPHITVAAYEVRDVEPLCRALRELTQKLDPFAIRLHALGVFAETGTVFLAPRLTSTLFSLHREVVGFFVPIYGDPLFPEHSSPDAWTPHCTLATRLVADDVPRVVRFCLKHWEVIEGRGEAIGVLVLPEKEDRCEGLLGQGS